MAKANKKIDKSQTDETFLIPFQNFEINIEGLRESLILSLQSTIQAQRKVEKEIDRYIEKHAQKKLIKNKPFYKLHYTHQIELESLQKNLYRVGLTSYLLPRSVFIAMVSQLDLLISAYIKIALEKHPAIISKDKTISFEEAKSFSSIDEIKNYFIDEEIDSVLRASHADHLEWFDKKLGLNLKTLLGDTFNDFIELTERRNLFVHTDGVVSNQYKRVCKKYNCKIDSSIKIGDRLTIDPEYYKKSFYCIYKVALKLSWCFYRKIYHNRIVDIDSFFSNFAIGMVRERSGLSEDFLSFFLDNCEGSRDLEKNLLTINLALSKYILGKKKEVSEVLGRDWSSVNPEFRLAVSVLQDNYEKAAEYMLQINKKSELIRQKSYYSDPIYDEFRKTEIFKKTYKKIFKEEYITVNE